MDAERAIFWEQWGKMRERAELVAQEQAAACGLPKPMPIIRRRVFEKLPRDLVLEYAQHYNVQDADSLSARKIYNAIHKGMNTRVRALRGHALYPTDTGVVVARNHDKLVLWLDEHEDMELNPGFWSEELIDKDDRVKFPEPEPEPEDAPSLLDTFSELLYNCIRPENACPNASSVKTRLFNVSMKLLAGCAGVEVANLVAGFATSFGRTYLGLDAPPTVSRKHPREEDKQEDAVRKRARSRSLSTVSSSSSSSSSVLDSPQILWEDYSDDSDSSYAPSSGTSESDYAGMTRGELWDASMLTSGRINVRGDISGDLSSDGETDDEGSDFEAAKIRWGDCDYPEESDSDDPDYVPPTRNFEDILEIISITPFFSNLDRLRYMNEVLESGPKSDAGLSESDSDSDAGYHHISTLQRTFERLDVPEHLVKYSSLPSYLRVDSRKPGQPLRIIDRREYLGDDWWEQDAMDIKNRVEKRRAETGWDEDEDERDVDEDIEFILTDGHRHLEYAFDDREWNAFGGLEAN